MPTHNESPSTIRYVPPTKEHLEALAAARAERRRRGATLKPKVDPLASAARLDWSRQTVEGTVWREGERYPRWILPTGQMSKEWRDPRSNGRG